MAENTYLTDYQKKLQTDTRAEMARSVDMAYNTLTPDKLTNFNSISNKYPNISKDLVMAMVSQGLNADTPGLGKIVSYDGIAQLKRDAQNVDKIKSTVKQDKGFVGSVQDALYKNTWGLFKGTTRVAFAGLQSLYDYATVLTRDITQGVPTSQLLKDFSQGIVGESTHLGQLARNWSNQGTGFFITPESKAGKAQARAMSEYGKINGESFTIGRYTAKSLGADADTTTYKILSGLVDATLMIGLDPTTYLGPGAATKVLQGGKKLKAAKAGVEGISGNILGDVVKMADEKLAGLEGVKTRTANSYLRKEKQIFEDTAHIYDVEARAAKKVLALEKESFYLFGADDVAKKTLSDANVTDWLITNPKTPTGELLSGVDNLSATHHNTGKVFLGSFITDELPEAGRVTVGVNQLDEYFVTGAKNVKWNVIDITDDLADAPQKVKSLEEKRRAALMARIEERSQDFTKTPAVRQGYDDLVKVINEEGKSLEGFLFDGLMTGKMQPMVALLQKVAATKNPDLMWNIVDDITEIWKVDGFANIRAMYGEMGGFAIREIDGKLAAKSAQIGNTLAEFADPTALGPNMAKVAQMLEEPTARLAKTEAKAAKAEKAAAEHAKFNKDLSLFRELVDSDPELLQKIVNDPNYKGLGKFLNLKAGKDKALIEFINEQVGLTDTFAGQLGTKYNKPLQYLLGRNFENIAKVVADETDAYAIRNYFGKKLDADMVDELTKATTPDEVMAVFLRNLAAETTDPKVFRSMALNAKALEMSASPLARLVDPVNPAIIRTAETLSRSYNRYFVRSKTYNLGDKTSLADGVENWLSSTRLASVIGKDTQEALIKTAVTKIIKSTSNQERAAIVEEMNTSFIEAITKRMGLDEKDIEALTSVAKVSGKEKAGYTTYSTNQLVNNTIPTMVHADGQVINLDAGLHEFQLLNDVINLPDTVEIQKIVNKFDVSKMKSSYHAGKIAAEELGDLWRSAQLVFRISYVIRNIAEMQMRQFLSGHAAIFSHPLQFTAMVMADPAGNQFQQKLAARYARYQTDLGGNFFKDAEAEGELMEAVIGYQKTAYRNGISTSDYRKSTQSEVFKAYEVSSPGKPKYYEGLAFTLTRMASDKFDPDIARLIVTGASKEDKMKYIDNLISEFDNKNSVLRDYALGVFKSNEGVKQFFLKNPELAPTADNFSPEGMFTFMFDEAQEHSLASQILSVAGSGPKRQNILDIIMNGQTKILKADGSEEFLRNPWLQKTMTPRELSVLEKEFTKKLEANFTVDDLADSRVLTERTSAITLKDGGMIKQGVDKFFEFASRAEGKWNFGPEYQMSYWDHVGRYARLLSTDDLKHAQKMAQKNLAPISKQVGNRVVTVGRRHPTLRVIEKELGKRLKDPAYGNELQSSWVAVHQMAAREAASYTKNLFYDAANQRQWANAWRLVFPFAQAQANTVATWSKLVKGAQAPAYKFGRSFQALTEEGSNVIYDATGITYDNDQGFIYRDETTGEERFTMPLVGSVLGALAGVNPLSPGSPFATDAQVTAPIQSLNLAFGQANPMLPGVGPAAQLAYIGTGKIKSFGTAYEIARDIISPYGEPKTVADVAFPSWFKKSFAYFLGDETTVNRGIKDWASYLASTGDYGDNPFASDQERTRLFEDAKHLSKSMGLMTALFQSISPATPSNQIIARIKDPENKQKMITLTLLADAWKQISKKYPGENGKAVVEFANKYGANNLMVAIGGTTRAVSANDDAWTFLNNNPDTAAKYARNPGDVVPYFFPGGNFSLKYYNWQKSTGARRQLNQNELENEAEGLVYAMRKDQIEQDMIAGGRTVYWYNAQIAQLDEEFNGRPSDFVQTGTAEEKMGRIADALQDPAFKNSPVYNETVQFYDMFSKFKKELNRLRVSNYAELKGKSSYATMARNDLVSMAESFIANNPAFSQMYYGVFAGQLED